MNPEYLPLEASEIASVEPLRSKIEIPLNINGQSDAEFLNVLLRAGRTEFSFTAIAVYDGAEITTLVDLEGNKVYTLVPTPQTNLTAVVIPEEDDTYGLATALPVGVQ